MKDERTLSTESRVAGGPVAGAAASFARALRCNTPPPPLTTIRPRARTLALLAVLLASVPAPAAAQDEATVTFDFKFTAKQPGGQSITGSFTAAPVGDAVGTARKYRLRKLLSVSVDGVSYADAISADHYPPRPGWDEFTWDAASRSVVGTKSSRGTIHFSIGTSVNRVLILDIHIGDRVVLESVFNCIRNGENLQFLSNLGFSSTTLTLQGDETETMTLDVDGNGTVGLLTDGLLLVRYLIDIRGPALTNLAVAENAHADRDTHQEIAAYLQGLVDEDVLDVDGNGTVGLLTDGLLIVRYLIDIRGPELTNLALASDARADRNEPDEIAAYLDSLLPPQ